MELRKGYTQTEFGIIPMDWNIVTIREVAEVKDGTHQTPQYMPYGIPFYSVESVTLNDFENTKFISHKEHILLTKSFKIEIDDVLMTRIGSIGDCKYIDWNVNASFYVSLALLKFKEKSIGKYFYHFSKSSLFKSELENHSLQHAVPKKINLGQISDVRILLPPTKDEQTAIATALGDMDALIASLEKLIDKKKAIKQGAMQELLKPKDGWEVMQLKDLVKYRRGSFPQPYGLDKWYDDINGYPFVQVFDVDNNFKLKEDTKRKISKAAQAYSVFIEKGSIIITLQGSIGRIAITQYDAYVDRTLLIFESFIVPFDKYYFLLLIHFLFEKEKEKAPGGIIKTITKEALSTFTIAFPNIEEQSRIAQILLDMANEIATIENNLHKFKLVKQGMMQELLTGKTRLI